MALQLQNTAYWLGKILQQRGLSIPLSVPPITEGFNVNEFQSTLNHQTPQQSSRRTGNGDGEASRRNEPLDRVRGRVVKELIENDGAKSYFSKLAEGLESEELETNYRLEKRPRRERQM